MKMINSFILRDESDTQWDDLIEFKEPVKKEQIVNAIQFVKDNIEDYTNQDIYNALSVLGEYNLSWIGGYDIIEY